MVSVTSSLLGFPGPPIEEPTMYRIYAAGACRHNNSTLLAYAGLGAFLINPQGLTLELAKPIDENRPTNNRAVMLAMIAALEILKGKPRSSIRVFSNNEMVITSAATRLAEWRTNGWKKSNKKPVENAELWQTLDEHLQNHEVSFEWLQGRSSCPKFKKASWLAQQGTDGRVIKSYSEAP